MNLTQRAVLVLITFAFCIVNVASAFFPDPGVNASSLQSLVAASYKEYAWTVVFGVDNTSRSFTSLSQESLVKLKRIFTDELALAVFNDAQCTRKTKEICALDFDILFDSQDPDVRDLTIQSKTAQSVEVCFIEQNASRRCLELVGASANGKSGVRIYDIKYDKAGRTLRTTLKLK